MSIFSRSYRRQIKTYDNIGLGKAGWFTWFLCWGVLVILLLLSQRSFPALWTTLRSYLPPSGILPSTLSPDLFIFLVPSLLSLWGLWQLALHSLSLQLLVAQSALFLLKPISPVRGLLRSLSRRVRHDLLLARLSPLHDPVYLWNSLPNAVSNFFQKHAIRIQFLAILVLGGIIIPVGQYVIEHGFGPLNIKPRSDKVELATASAPTAPSEPTGAPSTTQMHTNAIIIDPSAGPDEPIGASISAQIAISQTLSGQTSVSSTVVPTQTETAPASTPNLAITRTETVSFLQLMALGIISTLVLLSLWASARFVFTRQRHLVLRFEVPDNDQDLSAVATILTHKFVAHLQQIGFLLSSRQVENVNIRLENPLSLFVTSGQEEELVRQLSNWSDFEVSNIRLPIGRLLSMAVVSLANTRVCGTVQRTHNGAIEAWIEFYSRRAKRSFVIERLTIPNPAEELIDDTILDDMAHELAVRLAYQLGHTYNLASSWESLKWFLAGLEASSHRNWWYAIANYKRATEIEETTRANFGVGHYHIGATLLSQGEPHAALEHLQRAEASGPPSPETHYMLALAYLALNYENLDGARDRKRQAAPASEQKTPASSKKNSSQSANRQSSSTLHADSTPGDMIIHHLRAAIRLAENFPEAYHLLGIIYYQLARGTERSKDNTELPSDVNYLYSAHYFRRAVRGYRTNLFRLQRRHSYLPDVEKERIRIVEDEMIATHHLADALRSLHLYREAIEYYRDVQVAFPGRVRNLVDQAMTYCRWENWSMAQDFIKHEISQRTYAVWTADAQLYGAWAAAGAVNKPSFWLSFQPEMPKDERVELILNALTRLDMAIFLRPRFIFRRKQTDWIQVWYPIAPQLGFPPETTDQSTFHKQEETVGVNKLRTDAQTQRILAIYRSDFAHNSCITLLNQQVGLWLAWRIYTYLYDELYSAYIHEHKNKNDDLAILLRRAIPGLFPDSAEKHPTFQEVIETLRNHRRAAASLLFISDQERLLMRPDIIWRRVQLCKQVYANWQSAHRLWEQIYPAYRETATKENRTAIQFAIRWQLDIYVQVATFTCRFLAYSQDYQRLWETSDAAIEYVGKWIEFWATIYHGDFRFNPNLLRYHYVTLVTWKAYADLMCATQLGHKPDIRKLLEAINTLQRTAQNFRHTQHPLFLYVRAKFYQLSELHREAINDFVALLHVIEPFDSRSFNPFDFTLTLIREDLKEEHKELTRESIRTQLFYLERVSGQQQFDFLINNAQIDRDLAFSLQKIGETSASVDYLLRGLTWSPYKDFDMDNFVRLAKSLLDLDLFQEALAVVEEAKSRVGNYSKRSLRTSSLITLYVLECILRSRLENYGDALELGTRLAEQDPFVLKQLEGLPEEGDPDHLFTNPFTHMTNYFDRLRTTDPTKFIDEFVKTPETFEWSAITALFSALLRHLPISRHINTTEKWRVSTNTAAWLSLPREYLDAEQLRQALQTLQEQSLGQHDLYYEWHMIRELRLLAARGACLLLIQACELYNNIAYNLAKLGIAPNSARRYNIVAIFVMQELMRCLEETAGSNPEMATLFSQRLAQYYDTQAWIYFRRRQKHKHRSQSDLQTAIAILKDQSLTYDQNHPMPHYHLARAYLALAEAVWQDVEKTSHAIPTVAEEIRRCLSQASHHWKIANSLDKSGRLTTDLRICRQRLNEYVAVWRKAHTYPIPDDTER